jgi:hypothetical protein
MFGFFLLLLFFTLIFPDLLGFTVAVGAVMVVLWFISLFVGKPKPQKIKVPDTFPADWNKD